jgi:hypothetical protein
VPFYQFLSHRTQLLDRFNQRESPTAAPDFELKRYWTTKNAKSIDGLPSVVLPPLTDGGFVNCWERQRPKYEVAKAKSDEGSAVISVTKKDQDLWRSHLPVWIDEKMALSFLLGVALTTALHMSRASLR